MESTKDKFYKLFSTENNMLEKKGIVYLVILAILLIYFSIFFIHNIEDRKTLKDTQTATIEYPENNPNENVVDNSDRLRILEGAKEWSQLKELSIFNNKYFNGESKIAPGIHSTYNFTVENYGDTKMIYSLNFTEANSYNINMKYKLKQNGTYIAGDETTWVDYTALSVKSKIINPTSIDLYTLEWIWEDDDANDTQIGETEGANYKLHIRAYAEEVI